MASQPEVAERRADAILRFIEQLGLLFADSGMPRTAARTFAYMLVGGGRHTAADLAAGLWVSAGAISGAVRHLVEAAPSGYGSPLGTSAAGVRPPVPFTALGRLPSQVWEGGATGRATRL